MIADTRVLVLAILFNVLAILFDVALCVETFRKDRYLDHEENEEEEP